MTKIEIDVTVKGLGPLVDVLTALVPQGTALSTQVDELVQPIPTTTVPTTTVPTTVEGTVPSTQVQGAIPSQDNGNWTTQAEFVQPIPTTTVPTTALPFTAVPTTAVAQDFTIDQLSVAAAGLVNQGKQETLLALLTRFGVQTMVDLPKEQYGMFAQALKSEGAIL